ncbi:unnamed protein product [Microthlaspi erraticum]|uniref:Arabidopsis retrotransposon Orf1 C-terminal domain-containing protein n=1 Tax=Microthlaspi erraticum TaxID=1685480 RepID=A0A6D2LI62_9BRAS|nr:unnamed protein product [Microthlaspi erraticum]
MEKVTNGTSRKKNSKEFGLQSLMRGTLPQGPRLLRSGAQCLDMSQGSCQHLLCKESHWTINEGEVKLLDMGIKPIISRTRMGRRSEEIGHTQGISCLSLSSSKPTSWSQVDKRRSTPPGWMDIKFCKTNLLIEHKELDGRFQFKFTIPLAGLLQASLPNPELTTVLGGTTLTSDPLCTLWLGMKDLQEEEIELDRAEDRAEIS